jgi:hypothetical protein
LSTHQAPTRFVESSINSPRMALRLSLAEAEQALCCLLRACDNPSGACECHACVTVRLLRPSLFEKVTHSTVVGADMAFAQYQSQLSLLCEQGALRSRAMLRQLRRRLTERPSPTDYTHTLLAGGKLHVGDRARFTQDLSRDLADGCALTLAEFTPEQQRFRVFFDFDVELPRSQSFAYDDWLAVARVVQRCTLKYYCGATEAQRRLALSLTPPLLKGAERDRCKHAAHMVCPGLAISAADAVNVAQYVVEQLALEHPHVPWRENACVDTNVYKKRSTLRVNGCFKVGACAHCKHGSHKPRHQEARQCFSNGRRPLVYLDTARAWRDAHEYRVDLTAEDARCYTLRAVLRADGAVDAGAVFARQPLGADAAAAWASELRLTAITAGEEDELAAFVQPRELLAYGTCDRRAVQRPRNADDALCRADQRYEVACDVVRTQGGCGLIKPWANLQFSSVYFEPDTAHTSRLMLLPSNTRDAGFCLNKTVDADDRARMRAEGILTDGGFHHGNRVKFRITYDRKKRKAYMQQRCFCECPPSAFKRRKAGVCKNYSSRRFEVPDAQARRIFGDGAVRRGGVVMDKQVDLSTFTKDSLDVRNSAAQLLQGMQWS